MKTSNCCDALIINTDICSDCKEHCEAVDNTEDEDDTIMGQLGGIVEATEELKKHVTDFNK